jgi:hypothetical protein
MVGYGTTSVRTVTSMAAGEAAPAAPQAGRRTDADDQSGGRATADRAAGGADDDGGSRPATDDDRASVAGRPARRRLRDLAPAERWWAAALIAALLLAPAVAFAIFVPEWTPANDPALMGLRSLDVATTRSPLLGQPSQSGLYADSVASVHHPGPLHFYVMAAPVRLLGAATGMPLVSALLTGSCLVVAAWVVFRQLGRGAAVVAAVALSLVTFTTGASSLVNPVSSNIAGYPLLCTAVLAWGVGSGDVRLLPLATAAASFTAQQHLSVVPATAVLVAGGLGLLALTVRREGRLRRRDDRAEIIRWTGLSAVVALALWAPVLAQQAFGGQGNLGQMLWFARHGNRETLGYGSAVRQAVHAVGLPPLLGRTDLTGDRLLAAPSVLTWASAAAVLATVAVAGWRWRPTDARRAALAAMVGVVAIAGLVNGSSVPRGLEQSRLAFYHWTFVLAFLAVVVLALAVVEPLARAVRAGRPRLRPALIGVALVAVAVPALVNPRLDRRTNTAAAAYSPVEHGALADLAGAVEDHAGLLGDHTLLVARDEPAFAGIGPALALELAQRGVDVKHPLYDRFFVHDQRLVDADALDGGIVVVVDDDLPGEAPPGGELVAEVDLGTPTAVRAYRSLVAAARVDGVRPGPAAEQAVRDLPEQTGAFTVALLELLADDPAAALRQPMLLEFVRDHPLDGPAFDPRDIDAALAGLDTPRGAGALGEPTALRAYVLDRDEMLAFAYPMETGRPGG